MDTSPLFSIVIPVYNKARYIRHTLDSVLAQTLPNFEIIVVDDGSTDKSREIVESIHSNKIRIIIQANSGVSAARNHGIRESQGKWIAFLDADDTLYPHALEEYAKMMTMFPNAKVLITSYDTSIKRFISREKYHYCKGFYQETLKYYAKGSFYLAWTGCICVNKDSLNQIGGFNENYTHGEDIDMWYRLVSNFTTVKSEVTTAFYQLNTENNSSQPTIHKRSYSPISVVRPRNEYHGIYEKGWVGLNILHGAFPIGIRQNPHKHFSRIIHYMDSVLIYAYYLIKYRVLNCEIQ